MIHGLGLTIILLKQLVPPSNTSTIIPMVRIILRHVKNITFLLLGLLDQLAEYWWKVASEFKNYSSILGYEIINEPWAGSIVDLYVLLGSN